MSGLSEHPEMARAKRAGALMVDAHLHLLDRQVRDCDGDPVSAVADIEIGDWDPGGRQRPVIDALIVGSGIWARIFGMHPPPTPVTRIPWSLVRDLGTAVVLGVPGRDLEVTWVTRWLSERIIARIPGSSHAPE